MKTLVWIPIICIGALVVKYGFIWMIRASQYWDITTRYYP
jgi:hypothetical protein